MTCQSHDSPVSNMERAVFYLGSIAGSTVDTTLHTGTELLRETYSPRHTLKTIKVSFSTHNYICWWGKYALHFYLIFLSHIYKICLN